MKFKGDLLKGITVPVFPPVSAIAEFIHSGSTMAEVENMCYEDRCTRPVPSGSLIDEFERLKLTPVEIEREIAAFKNRMLNVEEYSESPFSAYKNGFGYIFKWGYILEHDTAPVEANFFHFFDWEFCLDTMLYKAHKIRMPMEQLSDLCVNYLYSLDKESWPVIVTDGSETSSFGLIRLAHRNSGQAAKELKSTRRWLAKEFVLKILPDLISHLNEILENIERQPVSHQH